MLVGGGEYTSPPAATNSQNEGTDVLETLNFHRRKVNRFPAEGDEPRDRQRAEHESMREAE